MEFNCEGRQLSHPLEDFLTSHLLLSFLAVHSTVFTEYPLVPETTVLFSEGKPSLKKKNHILQIKDLILWLLIYYICFLFSMG